MIQYVSLDSLWVSVIRWPASLCGNSFVDVGLLLQLKFKTVRFVVPSQPTDFKAEAKSETSILLSWVAPPQSGQDSQIAGYELLYKRKDEKEEVSSRWHVFQENSKQPSLLVSFNHDTVIIVIPVTTGDVQELHFSVQCLYRLVQVMFFFHLTSSRCPFVALWAKTT